MIVKVISRVDKDGFLIETRKIRYDETRITKPIPRGWIGEPVPDGLYMPRWDGASWGEGASQQEIDEIEAQKPENIIRNLQEENNRLREEKELTDNALLDFSMVILGVKGGE